MIYIRIFLLLITWLMFTAEADAQLNADVRREVENAIKQNYQTSTIPGISVSIMTPDGKTYSFAEGFSDKVKRTPMRPTDIMLAGSTGKMVAATVVMQLVGEGKIGLDDKIEKYLRTDKWFDKLPNSKDITVRQLLNHTSGLVRYEFKKSFTDALTANPLKEWTPEERLAFLDGEKAPFAAGSDWVYSDTNYIVLGILIEKITGQDYFAEADKRVLKPLALKNTHPQKGNKIKGLIQGYAGENNPFGGKDEMVENGRLVINPQLEWTGGGYASNTADLVKLTRAIFEAKLYNGNLLEQTLDGSPAKGLGEGAKYGLGVIIRNTKAGISYGHSGFFPGYMTDVMYFPDTKITVAVQVNTSVTGNLKMPNAVFLSELAILVNAKL